MKKILTILALALTSSCAMMAQDAVFQRRGRVRNDSEQTSLQTGSHRKVGNRASAPLPCTGNPKVPVVLVQFSDLQFTTAESDSAVNELFTKLFNGTGIPGKPYRVSGGSWGSVSDYFIEQSDSLYKPEFEIIGPVTLSRSYTYYGEGDPDRHLNDFYNEACKLAISQFNVNWNKFDNNNDDVIDFAFFVYAGNGANDKQNADVNAIWPSEMTGTFLVNADETTLTIGGCGCCNELYNGELDGIGTICHELSHGLGLPDLYDYNYVSFGMDIFDVMDYGNYQIDAKMPCCYSGYERDFMGWRKLVEIQADSNVTLVIDPIEAGGVAYKITNPANQDEYFILENRQNIGFDTYYGCAKSSHVKNYGTCHGLLITHIDYSSSVWSGNRVNSTKSHQRCTLVPADGNPYNGVNDSIYLESLRTDLYPAGGTEMSNYSTFSGGKINTRIWDIKENEDLTVTVKINDGTPIADAIVSANAESEPTAIYSIGGTRQQSLQRGMNIVRMSDGSVKKILVK